MKIRNNITLDDIRTKRVQIPKEDSLGEFSKFDEFHPFMITCNDYGKYRLGNLFNNSKTKSLIFICGDCFETRINKTNE